MNYSIGELARLTDVTVKTLRAWSNRGLLPPASRNHAGHRRYDDTSLARARFVKTLRELGIGLAAIERVVNRQVALADVARAHADALAIQIRGLRHRHAVLTAMTVPHLRTEEMTVMHRLTRDDEHEQRRLIGAFLDGVFGGLDDPAFEGIRRSWTPVFGEKPTDTQLAAWAELAGLAADDDFQRIMRRSAEMVAEDRARSGVRVAHPDSVTLARQGRAVYRPDLAEQLAAADDPRRHRYQSLLSTINGWAG